MSRNSKNARLHAEARARKGNAGPKATTPKHGKRTRAWANQPGVKRSSLTYTPGQGWARANPN